jgi:hypothetical protein
VGDTIAASWHTRVAYAGTATGWDHSRLRGQWEWHDERGRVTAFVTDEMIARFGVRWLAEHGFNLPDDAGLPEGAGGYRAPGAPA